MNTRRLPRLGWDLSEVGYGMWGMGGWTGSDDAESAAALDRAVALGCNFFDTAWAYGEGRSERLLGDLVRRHAGQRLLTATKVPPKDRVWPGKGTTPVSQVFPYEHIIDYTDRSLQNLGTDAIDLQQLHVWDDSWAEDDGWKRAVEDLKRAGKIRAFGISVNRWEPDNVLHALDTTLVDAVQVVYNIFDQAPEDLLFDVCAREGIGVIARVPFDEGSLTGTLTHDARWPDGDFRNIYFQPLKLAETLVRVEPLKALAAGWGEPLPSVALRFILAHKAVTTVIPGMRAMRNVEANLSVSGKPMPAEQVAALRAFRWDRKPDFRP
ncbi:MAG: aldo/keto reductase [Vicinamibacterales bacterium]|jgi:aryl-alcohol dehydrogenase-like predicted oxidoreductase